MTCFLFSCTNMVVTSPAPEITSVDPGTVFASIRTPAIIKGENFLGRIRGQVDKESPTSDMQFRVIIGDVEIALADVTFVHTETLNIVVPSGMALGGHDVTVITPGDRSATLPQALTVIDGNVTGTSCGTNADCEDPCRSIFACIEGQCASGGVDKDADEDGFFDIACPGGTDCDDDPAACGSTCNTAGTEVCDPNDYDEDCDGFADDLDVVRGATGKLTYYPDLDTDTYGDDSVGGTDYCDPPGGVVLDNSDCDDSIATGFPINPAATEVCDAADNNCVNGIDEPGTSDGTLYYADADGDTYGDDADAGTRYCSNPGAGFSTDNTDCDDSCDVCWTGHAEVCGDGEDNNCSGDQDEEGSQGCASYYLDWDQDGHGHLTDSKCLCAAEDAGGYNVTAPGNDDCDDASGLCTTLCNDVDLDLLFDCKDDCLDVDGDGLGNGNLNNAGCIDATTDSDDADDIRCADTDTDACDDCRWGTWDPFDDGFDLEGDGICELLLEDHQAASETLPGAETQVVVGISPSVGATSSILVFNFAHNSVQPDNGLVTGQLSSDGASVVFDRIAATEMIDVQIEWSVVELDQISVQRGSTLLTQGLSPDQAVEVTLSPDVDPTRSFVVFSIRVGGSIYSWNDWAKAKLIDGSTLGFYRGTSGQASFAEWQVIEFEAAAGALVQHGETSLAIGIPSANVDLPTPAPLDRSFLLFSHLMAAAGGTQTVNNHVIRGRMVSDTELVFERDGTDLPMELCWSVVTWDGMRAQHGNASFATGEGEKSIPLANTVNPDAAVSFLTGIMREGKSPYSVDDGVGVAWFTTDIQNGGDTVVIRRGSTVDTAETTWAVVEFQ
ncbi:IPT/TIG domain-containing protein [Myxococcota bacterium]